MIKNKDEGLSLIRTAKNYLDFVVFYTKAKLEAENFRNHAGYAWWLLDPIIGLFIYYFLFKVILKRGGPDYIQFLFIGLVTWKWFADSVSKGSAAIISNLSLIKKIKIGKEIFPVVETLYHSWKFLIIFTLVLLFYFFLVNAPSLVHLLLIPLLLVEYIFILGVTLFLSSITPLIPDLKFLIGYAIRLMFYPSGILFSVAIVPEKYRMVVLLNPMAGLVQSYRDIVINGAIPKAYPFIYCSFIGLILGGVGLYVIKKYDMEYPKIS